MCKPLLLSLLIVSSLLGLFFAFAGAGMYGSPFTNSRLLNRIHLLGIIGLPPLVLFGLLVFGTSHGKRSGYILCSTMIAAAIMAWCHDFRYFWLPVFAVLVWGPCLVIGMVLICTDS